MAAIGSDNEKILGIVKKNPYQDIVVAVGDYNGRPYVYMRMERQGNQSVYGITLRPETARELLGLLCEAVAEAESREQRRGPGRR